MLNSLVTKRIFDENNVYVFKFLLQQETWNDVILDNSIIHKFATKIDIIKNSINSAFQNYRKKPYKTPG